MLRNLQDRDKESRLSSVLFASPKLVEWIGNMILLPKAGGPSSIPPEIRADLETQAPGWISLSKRKTC